MSPEQWQRVGELFHEALEVGPDQRETWAAQLCADDPEVRRELLSLLDHDRTVAVGFVERSVKSAVLSLAEANDPVAQGLRVGPYKLVRELGRGGMGTVYLAERDDGQYQTNVAVKLVRPGMDTEIILHASAANARFWPISSIPISPACWTAALPVAGCPTSSWSMSRASRSTGIVKPTP